MTQHLKLAHKSNRLDYDNCGRAMSKLFFASVPSITPDLLISIYLQPIYIYLSANGNDYI